MAKCKYKYKNYPNKKCPHNAEPGSDFCKWHEPKDRKDFSGQKIKEKDLVEAYLVKANLSDAYLQKANLSGAKIQEAILSGADLQGTDLDGADLQEADLRYAHLQRADLRYADLQEADLYGAHLQGADLRYVHLKGADLGSANLKGADLRYAHLQKVDLWNANLKGADLGSANLKGADLDSADLKGADLYGADLQGIDLWNANLKGADLGSANLKGADLDTAALKGANLYDSDLTDTLFNNGTDLRGAILYAAEIKNAKRLQYAKISGKNPGEMCIEELLADNIYNLFNSKETDFEKAMNKVIKPHLNKLGFKESENDSEQFKICGDVDIPSRGLLEEIFTKRPISQYKENEIRLHLYEMAKDVYINLKDYFKNAGLYDESGNFFIGEFRVRGKISEISAKQSFYELFERIKNFFRTFILRKRKENKTYMPETKTLKLIGSMILNYSSFLMNKIQYITSSYGESMLKIIFTALSVIGICALFYWWIGGIVYSACSNPTRGFWTNLYFSIVTFTTLGYGDLHPVANTWIRLAAGFEAFSGAFLLAYFVVIVSRKIMR